MFETSIKPLGAILILKRVCIPLLSLYLCIGLISAYRAWYQVRSLDLRAGTTVLHAGAHIATNVVSYARTPISVRVELIQGGHAETIATQHVPDNDWAFFDPRNQSASQVAILTADVLNRFDPGSAVIRATAIGCPQWTRLPPPVIREVKVEIAHD